MAFVRGLASDISAQNVPGTAGPQVYAANTAQFLCTFQGIAFSAHPTFDTNPNELAAIASWNHGLVAVQALASPQRADYYTALPPRCRLSICSYSVIP